MDAKLVFGGDFNMRDNELKLVNDGNYFASNIQDSWVATGQNPDSKFTWDLVLNDNKVLPFKCRCRFDRLYLNKNIRITNFKLEGTRKLTKSIFTETAINRFVSDHFGISVIL